jgi:AraC family transcriptional regulator, transcriptional activator of pobA
MSHSTHLMEDRHTDPIFPIHLYRNKHPYTGEGQVILGLHWHVHMEIILMTVGEAVFVVNGRSYHAKQGDLLFINSGELHTGYSKVKHQTEFVAIVFHPELLASPGFDPHHGRTIARLLTGEHSLPAFVETDNPMYPHLSEPILAVIREMESREGAYEIHVKLQLSLAFAQISRYYSQPSETKESVHPAERFKPLITYMQAHYAEKLTVDVAARMMNLSSYHFCKCFKKATGHTFGQFLQLLRIAEAERRLLETELTVTEIAAQVGFCDINYFDKVFKKVKHCPPTDIRKRSRINVIGVL